MLPLILSALLMIACSHEIEKVVAETFENGNPKLVRIYEKVDDHKQMVKEIAYYSNGQIRYDGEFASNVKHGKWVYYYQSGKKWSEGSFSQGERDGEGTTWHNNGQIYMHGSYSKGIRMGRWQFWDETGKLVKEIDYEE